LAVAAGSVGIVAVDTSGNICSFTPYFELWKLQLADVRRSKVYICIVDSLLHTPCRIQKNKPNVSLLTNFHQIWHKGLAINASQCGIITIHFSSHMYAHYFVKLGESKLWQKANTRGLHF